MLTYISCGWTARSGDNVLVLIWLVIVVVLGVLDVALNDLSNPYWFNSSDGDIWPALVVIIGTEIHTTYNRIDNVHN